MKQKELIEQIRKTYPCFNKTVLCMLRNPQKYGVQPLEDLRGMITLPEDLTMVKPALNRARRPARKKPNRISVYLSDEEYEAMKKDLESLGCKTVQEYLERKIKNVK